MRGGTVHRANGTTRHGMTIMIIGADIKCLRDGNCAEQIG